MEDFTILIDGNQLTAVDRNVWGVTFAGDDKFFATVGSGDNTWLVSGSLEQRTMTSVVENAECPSISPDGKQAAFKKRRTGAGPVHWDIAVLELDSKKETVIRLRNGFDDQLEWLDNSTLLYGAPRDGAIGDSDIFSLEVAPNARPELFIEHAWSPSVER
ncbi:hypothetical protein [Arthrobacter rhombi]|uniref:hypothetical protein n=1 Tax=Arthrobacter rhombi TaxID=71253 RepID=UPI003FD06D34